MVEEFQRSNFAALLLLACLMHRSTLLKGRLMDNSSFSGESFFCNDNDISPNQLAVLECLNGFHEIVLFPRRSIAGDLACGSTINVPCGLKKAPREILINVELALPGAPNWF